ncbi:MAG: AmmeMemoRadiSam system protein B, partial [Candidatus Aminicenantes bacterium]|nr:AmmeMemoRadiSam system protein B [Candidatus Aminicenantes bacterium]
NPEELTSLIESLVDPKKERIKALAIISPHAGYVYSGPVAGALFSSVQLPEKYILLGPSHRKIRSKAAIMRTGTWSTPLGDIPVDTDLADLLLSSSTILEEDEEAHRNEHSLEVQFPFIQYFVKQFSIVPISIGSPITYEELEELGRAVANGIKKCDSEALMIASTDMSHYVEQAVALNLDFIAIQKIKELNPRGFYDTVMSKNISMCGFQPTTSALVASKELGAKTASLIKYQTSGDISGNYAEVVGYAGIVIE